MMTAVLINDLKDPSAAANPAVSLDHPLELFMEAANHGGFWRMPYQPRSVLFFSVCLGSINAVKRKFKKRPVVARAIPKAGINSSVAIS